MLLDTDGDKNIDLIGEKVYFLSDTYFVGHRIQGSPGPLWLKYAVAYV